MKFIMYVWFAFFTRQRPDSTIANPACMNMTRNPVTSVQIKLAAILFWPTWLATSGSVTPFVESAAGTSLMVPVMVPPGSPLAKSAVVGALAAAAASWASAAEGGGAVDGGGAAAGGCAGYTHPTAK